MPSTRRPCRRRGATAKPFLVDELDSKNTAENAEDGASSSHRRERSTSCPPVPRPRGD